MTMGTKEQSRTCSVSLFKAKALGIFDEVQRTGRSIVVTKRGKPIAKVTPVLEEQQKRVPGRLRDTVIHLGDIVSPVAADDWDAAK